MNLLYAFVMLVVSYALQSLITPKIRQENPEAGKLEVPTAEEGGSIPVCFGTNLIKDSNVIWYGDSKTTPIYTEGGGKK